MKLTAFSLEDNLIPIEVFDDLKESVNAIIADLENERRKNKALELANKRAYSDGFDDCKKADNALIAELRRELEAQGIKASVNANKLINDFEKWKHLYNSAFAELALVTAERDNFEVKAKTTVRANLDLAGRLSLIRDELRAVKAERDEYKAALQNWHESEAHT